MQRVIYFFFGQGVVLLWRRPIVSQSAPVCSNLSERVIEKQLLVQSQGLKIVFHDTTHHNMFCHTIYCILSVDPEAAWLPLSQLLMAPWGQGRGLLVSENSTGGNTRVRFAWCWKNTRCGCAGLQGLQHRPSCCYRSDVISLMSHSLPRRSTTDLRESPYAQSNSNTC